MGIQSETLIGRSKVSFKWRALAILIALGGGVLGILGAIIQELSQGSPLVAFVAAPMIEEVMKPSGVYLLLVLRPEVLTSRIYTALLAALGGLSFAVIENIIYLQFYFPEHTQTLVVFRYSACLTMHVVCSFILGFGINQKLLASIRGDIPLLKGNKKFFIIPMIMHSLFNIMAVIFQSRLGVQIQAGLPTGMIYNGLHCSSSRKTSPYLFTVKGADSYCSQTKSSSLKINILSGMPHLYMHISFPSAAISQRCPLI